MKPKNIIALCIIACVLIIIATVNRNKTATTLMPAEEQGKKLFGKLDINNVEKIEVTSQEYLAVITRHDGKWLCETKHNYPANFEKIRSTLLTLGELKIGEKRISQATDTDRAMFQTCVPDADTQDNTGTKYLLVDGAWKVLASFVLGKPYERSQTGPATPAQYQYGSRTEGRFIEFEGDIYLTAESLVRLTDTEVSWLDSDLLHVPDSEILSVLVEDADGQTFEIFRSSTDESFGIEELFENEELEKWTVDRLARTFNYLSFTDIVDPEIDPQLTGMDQPLTVTAIADHGTIYKLMIGSEIPEKTDRYAKLSVEFDQDFLTTVQKQQSPETDDTEAKAVFEKAKIDQLATLGVAQQKAVKLNTQLSDWIFAIPANTVQSVTTDREKFVKIKEKPEALVEDDSDFRDQEPLPESATDSIETTDNVDVTDESNAAEEQTEKEVPVQESSSAGETSVNLQQQPTVIGVPAGAPVVVREE
ncbi:MAG: DUF4340 domain-containing protein [Lentisphaerae bacterium]|nr:DUF4340 domain-containing protein [Lentisphaerota bacterium]